MKAVIQRVNYADVKVGGETVGETGKGYLILFGAAVGDTEEDADRLAAKISTLRIFSDENDKINLSIKDVGGDILCVSQFTLCADCRKGNRPSFTDAMPPEEANRLYEYFCDKCAELAECKVGRGVFGADMKVTLQNDGPFTVMLECKEGKII
ncbi:D-aminoacyl-tRNA deacylase [Ruminococcus sp. NK3A76]|uniref:D-aminoacyl-tRNA deacylase n=1 Tax=Ruminococcus sp. NK3A76 TaxID=877411 RepID=UPI00048CACE5|nr:D-aminoacyl-tRNA deacylase [Ruminococcus sp. NK3A76]